MPQVQNNKDLYKFPTAHKDGIIGSAIIHIVALLFLFIFEFTAPEIETEEGILVNFGFDETGLGMIEPSGGAAAVEEAYVPPSATEEPIPSTNVSEEDPLLTQNFEEAPVVKQVDPEVEKKRQEEIEAEKKRQAELEAERRRIAEEERIKREQEEAEKRRIAEEQQRAAAIADRTRNAFANAQAQGTSSTSEGVAGGTGNQGDPNGSVSSTNRGTGSVLGNNGVSYDLKGRGVQTLPLPQYNYQGEGRVVVEVRVDKNGRVTQATTGKQGTTTYDEYLHNAAKEAALKTVFEPDPNNEVQIGTITYNFKLN